MSGIISHMLRSVIFKFQFLTNHMGQEGWGRKHVRLKGPMFYIPECP